jgi:putative lumazine-binding protein
MPDPSAIASLNHAIERYFELMYSSDAALFDQVFCPTAQLHGFREGALSMWSAQEFKDVLAGRPSPKSLNAPREEEILLVDVASATQAIAKVRVRINAIVFVDYLTFHRTGGAWMITSKAYHVER